MNTRRPRPTGRPTDRSIPWWAAAPAQVAVVLAACLLVYWVGLGRGGLHSTEGHRVIPGLEILRTGDWLVTTMFEQPYLRKPPGMPWAVAVSSWLFGASAWSARAVSALAATAMALIAWRFGRAWFGPIGGLASGLASALLPWFLESGRAAEIEALNTLGSQMAALPLLALLVVRRRGPDHGPDRGGNAHHRNPQRLNMALAAAGVVVLGLAKGPASVPLLVGVLGAGAIVCGWRALASLRVWAPLAAGVLVVGGVYGLIAWRVASLGVQPVTQSPAAFAFEPGKLVGVALLPIAAFVAAMPASLAVLFPWGPNAARERTTSGCRPTPRLDLARALAWAWVLTVVVSMVIGLSNVRYTLPAAVLLPPLVGYAVATLHRGMTPARDRIARAMLLGRPWVWVPVLLIGAGVYVGTVEASKRSSTGRDAGRAMAARLIELDPARPIVVVADQMIEARPETLLSLRTDLETAWGRDAVRVRWVPGLSGEALSSGGAMAYVLRWAELDGGGVEHGAEHGAERWAAERLGVTERSDAAWSGRVHEHTVVLIVESGS